MKASYFIIAESVHMYPEGKLVIVGTFDLIKVAGFPFVFRSFGIAARVDAQKSEKGRKYQLDLTLRKSRSRTPILSIPWILTFPRTKGRVRSAAVLGLMLPQLEFKSAGDYVFELKSGKRSVGESVLCVRKTKKPKKTKEAPSGK